MVFIIGLSVLVVLTTLLYLFTTTSLRRKNKENGERSSIDADEDDPRFSSFQICYLTVYLLAVAGDWLQGPHVYALYDSYGMSKHQIEQLFIAGFGSSLAFGTFVGSIADKYGRRANCLLYALLYGCSCVTKHFPNFNILLAGRLLGGIATSILFSAFESWLVHEHFMRGFSQAKLSTLFSNATLGNSIVAILAGFVAQLAADAFGYVAPFDTALLALIVMATIVMLKWPENYGDAQAPIHQSFVEAIAAIKDDKRILCLGLVQSLFEASMYTFVLEWTPALSLAYVGGESDNSRETIPHGLTFASFMQVRAEQILRFTLPLAALCLATPILMPNSVGAIYVAFIVFEACVGLFWPAMGLLRGIYLPEASRSTIMNFFRVPLNGMVVLMLWQNLSMETIFQLCVASLLIAAAVQQVLYSMTTRNTSNDTTHYKRLCTKEASNGVVEGKHGNLKLETQRG